MTAPLLAVALAYLLAAIPVGAVVLAGRMSPVYARPTVDYLRWWSWCALCVLVSAWLWGMAAA